MKHGEVVKISNLHYDVSVYLLPSWVLLFLLSSCLISNKEDLSWNLIRNYIISNIITVMFYHKVKPDKNFVRLANNEQNFSHNWMSSNNVNVFLSLFMCIVWKYGMSVKIIIYKFRLRGFLLNLVVLLAHSVLLTRHMITYADDTVFSLHAASVGSALVL